MPLDPALNVVLEQLNAGDGPKLHEVSPELARTFFDSMQVPMAEIAIEHVEDSHFPGPSSEISLRIYRPASDVPLPVLVYFHGGGWVIGSIESHDGTCRALASGANCAVISVEYRLAPENPYPAAADDCFAALEWVAKNADPLGIDGTRIAVGGDSAGGNLAAAVSLMARDRDATTISLQLLIYPVTDADFETGSYHENATGYLLERASMEWFWGHYVPDVSQRNDAYAAPLQAKSLRNLPPALVITAEFDPLRDEGEAFASRLKEAGVPTTLTRYDGMIHGFFGMGMIAEGARQAVAEACEALDSAFRTS